MMTGSVLDILIYVFDRYMLDEVPEVPEREHLVRDLERAGFAQANVERALDWLPRLPGGSARSTVSPISRASAIARPCLYPQRTKERGRRCGFSPTASSRDCRRSAAG